MGHDDEDLFAARWHASRIRDRDEWDADTGVHAVPPQIIMMPAAKSERSRSLIPKAADAVSKVLRNAKSWPAVVALFIVSVTFAISFYLWLNRSNHETPKENHQGSVGQSPGSETRDQSNRAP